MEIQTTSALQGDHHSKNTSISASAPLNNKQSLKIAIATALARWKLQQSSNQNQDQNQNRLCTPPPTLPRDTASDDVDRTKQRSPGSQHHLHPHSDSDSLKWKQKAKKRKEEILRLREDLRAAEDSSHHDLFPNMASCKCYFFDQMGEFSDGFNQRFNDVLRRRFLRQVRIVERRKRRANGLTQQYSSECNIEDQMEQLRASVDFLAELVDSVCPLNLEEKNFKNWSHQAVDFVLASLKALLVAKNVESLEAIVNSLIMRMLRRMCNTSVDDELHRFESDTKFYVQHLMRKLGSEPFIGHRVILSLSQRISMVAECLLFMDPFNDVFPDMHKCMHMMIQLIEFLVTDYLLKWSASEDFDIRLFEEWVTSVLHARKAVELLESRNTLYILYMDRVIGEITKDVGQFSFVQKLNPEILTNLFS